MESNVCAGCRFYDPRKMYCYSYLAGIENVVWRCTVNDDVVPVVRCKDCKHRIINPFYNKERPVWEKAECELDTGDQYKLGRKAHLDDWYCADGERKDDET